MQHEFWLARWDNQEIGFHQQGINPWLKKLWPQFGLPAGSAVFVPLCGKTRDMAWLAERGHRVFGVELAEAAVRAFFDEAGCACRMERLRHMLQFEAGAVTIYCGDFMDLTTAHLPGVAAVYDRAALIALPEAMRAHYADHLQRIVPDGCIILLVTLEYDQQRTAGPPWAVAEPEVRRLFGERCRVQRVDSGPSRALPPRFAHAGVDEAEEVVYLITKTS